MGLSAVLIVRNEEKNIRECLSTLDFCDEIVVLDSGSTDKTPILIRTLASKTASRVFDDFSSQRNFAIGLAAQDWILSIDADERVSKELKKEIQAVIASPAALDAYRIHRKTNFFGRDFKASGLQDDAPIRLFRRGRAFYENPVHEVVKVTGRTGKLKSRLWHISFQTIHEHLEKLQLYTAVEAAGSGPLEKEGNWKRFFARPFYRFFSIYVIKQGFRDGREGFVYAVLSAYYEVIRWMKKWERAAKQK